MTRNSDAKFEYTLTLWFQKWHEELGELSLQCITRVMQNLKES